MAWLQDDHPNHPGARQKPVVIALGPWPGSVCTCVHIQYVCGVGVVGHCRSLGARLCGDNILSHYIQSGLFHPCIDQLLYLATDLLDRPHACLR